MVKENNTSRQQGCTSVLEYSHSKREDNQSDTNVAALTTCSIVNVNTMENMQVGGSKRRVREIAKRSMQNDRRGQKPRNLFAVETYNRRSKERRNKLASSPI